MIVAVVPAETGLYKYTDRRGVVHYVDHLSRIPPQYRDQHESMKLRKDPLSPNQRAVHKAQQELRRRQMLNHFNVQSFETRVQIRANHVLVPVTLGYRGREVGVRLILDTGASSTLLDEPFRTRLGMRGLQKIEGRVAGGGIIQARMGTLDYIRIGPAKVTDVSAAFAENGGRRGVYDGLLGMNVLRRFEHTIDYERGVIRWKLR
jgi:predicted aspartyl protease